MSYVIEWHGISQKFYVQTEPTQTVCLRIVYAENCQITRPELC